MNFGGRLRYMAGFLGASVVLAAVSGMFLFGAEFLGALPVLESGAISAQCTRVIVIDAGHGGEDGGACAEDGTMEKDLNLAVATATAQLLRAAGFDVRMTREDDRLLYDLYGEQTDYSGKKKTYDLKNRLRFTKENGAALFVSIHMNQFPSENVRGLQVYYAASDKSRTVAEAIQNHARTYLQPTNTRLPKKTTSAIYLLHRMEIPAVLVECGFLSNAGELEKLKDPQYRQALALTIAVACTAAMDAIQG